MASSRSVLPWSTCPITVTTGGRGARRLSSTSSSSGSSSSATPTIWGSKPNSAAKSSIVLSERDCVADVTISPMVRRVLMTSAGLRPVFSATSWAEAPRATFRTGRPAGG